MLVFYFFCSFIKPSTEYIDPVKVETEALSDQSRLRDINQVLELNATKF